MFQILPMLLAASIAAESPTASDGQPPVSEATIERFLAVLPDADRLEAGEPTADPAELESLGALNPGRIEEIRPVLERFEACTAPISRAGTLRIMRSIAGQLGEEKVARLIAFYEGEDFVRLDALMTRTGNGTTASAEEQAEIDRIMGAYPLGEFMQAMQPSNPLFWQDESMAEIIACHEERDQALERLGVRTALEVQPPQAEPTD